MKKLIAIPLVLLAACASQGKGTADIAIYDLAGANAPSSIALRMPIRNASINTREPAGPGSLRRCCSSGCGSPWR